MTQQGDGRFIWYWGFGKEPESYFGRLGSRAAAIKVAIQNIDKNDPEIGFTICQADKIKATTSIFDADEVLDQYVEANEVCWGEDGPDICPTPEQKESLKAALADTLAEWLGVNAFDEKVFSFCSVRHEEFISAEEARALSVPDVGI